MIDGPHIPGLLVAMPHLKGSYFEKTVILLKEYNEEGAFGLVINLSSSVQVRDILENGSKLKGPFDTPLLVGGPVQPEMLWSIHTSDYSDKSTTPISADLSISSIQSVLSAVLRNKGPQYYHMGCGYAGWDAGQLDQEIRDGAWWLSPLDPDLVLQTPYSARWDACIQSIGLDPLNASFGTAGEV